MELVSPALQADSLPAELPGKPNEKQMTSCLNKKSAEYFANIYIELVDSKVHNDWSHVLLIFEYKDMVWIQENTLDSFWYQ